MKKLHKQIYAAVLLSATLYNTPSTQASAYPLMITTGETQRSPSHHCYTMPYPDFSFEDMINQSGYTILTAPNGTNYNAVNVDSNLYFFGIYYIEKMSVEYELLPLQTAGTNTNVVDTMQTHQPTILLNPFANISIHDPSVPELAPQSAGHLSFADIVNQDGYTIVADAQGNHYKTVYIKGVACCMGAYLIEKKSTSYIPLHEHA